MKPFYYNLFFYHSVKRWALKSIKLGLETVLWDDYTDYDRGLYGMVFVHCRAVVNCVPNTNAWQAYFLSGPDLGDF